MGAYRNPLGREGDKQRGCRWVAVYWYVRRGLVGGGLLRGYGIGHMQDPIRRLVEMDTSLELG